MKKTLIISLKAILLVSILISSHSCNFGAKESETDDTALDQEAFNTLVEGVYEYVAPNMGYAIMVNGYYAFSYGVSDTAMVAHAGTYEISGDTVTTSILFATKPVKPGGSFRWTASALEGDSILASVFDEEGNVRRTVRSIKLKDATKENTSSFEAYEGIFQYTAPMQGLAIDFEGYFIYLGGTSDTTMDFNSGAYTVDNEIVSSSIEYSFDPQRIGTTLRWMAGQSTVDTLVYQMLNDDNEVTSSGKSLRLK